MWNVRRQLSRLGIPQPPATVPEAAGSAPARPAGLPLPLLVRPPGLGRSLPCADRSSRLPLSARESRVRGGLGSVAFSLPGRTLLGMLSAPPGTRLSRGQDRVSRFSRLPRGRWGGEASR